MSDFWTKSARRSLEQALKTQVESSATDTALGYTSPAHLYVRWPGYSLPTPMPDEYVRFSFHPAPRRVVTMGPNGRIEGRGFAKIGVFTRLGESQDRNDTIAGIVAAAYPYNLNLVRDGIRVTITTTDHGQFVERDGWGYSPVDANWDVWRTN